jgi:hypothetical protein
LVKATAAWVVAAGSAVGPLVDGAGAIRRQYPEKRVKYRLLPLLLAFGLMLSAVQPAWAFIEDAAPTFANGGVDPEATGDPPAVAAAQRALEEFFAYTNRVYSARGFANAWLMREEVGNRPSNWLNKVVPLACGRLVGGWKSMNWVPGRGWQQESPSRRVARGASVPCEFTAPSLANGGVDPRLTADPAAVAAAQKALDRFYRETNRGYSKHGYSSPWVMREDLGNEQSAWLDMTLPLARAQLIGGWQNMNWISGKGWRLESPSLLNLPSVPLVEGASDGEMVFAWTASREVAAALPPILAQAPRKPPVQVEDPEARRIMQSLRLELGGEDRR